MKNITQVRCKIDFFAPTSDLKMLMNDLRKSNRIIALDRMRYLLYLFDKRVLLLLRRQNSQIS